MKVCIITLYGNWNYGNKLQNYALQTVIENLGHTVISLRNNLPTPFKEKVRYQIYALRNHPKIQLMKKREKNFQKFNQEYMHYTSYLVKDTLSKKREAAYDKFVIGSDQVWNYGDGYVSPLMFGLFTKKEKNISYAASFGISSIPPSKRHSYETGLNHIASISVREKQGAQLVEECIGIKPLVTCDPTMLLTKADWEKIERKPSFLKEKEYIVTYFLGNLSIDRQKEIEAIAKENDLSLIALHDERYPEYFTVDPSQFLYLIHHAKLVVTDSFHACVFSILYQKPFFVYDREDRMQKMSSRIDTLLELFQEEKRLVQTLPTKDLFSCDYTKGEKEFLKKKQESIAFLENALKKE